MSNTNPDELPIEEPVSLGTARLLVIAVLLGVVFVCGALGWMAMGG